LEIKQGYNYDARSTYYQDVSSFSYISVICTKLVLFLIPLQFNRFSKAIKSDKAKAAFSSRRLLSPANWT
jgi:hypothetical protein